MLSVAAGDESTNAKSVVGEIEFQVSKVIGRLEEVVEGRSPVAVGVLSPSQTNSLPTRADEDIFTQLEALLAEATQEEGSGAGVRVVPEPVGLAAVCHAVAFFTATLDRPAVQQMATRITADASKWITQLFRLGDGGATGVSYHLHQWEGLVRVGRALLHASYPHHLHQGYDALKARPPVFYSSAVAPIAVVQHLCQQLGLPSHCVRAVPCCHEDGGYRMDAAALERLITDDEAAGRLPLMVIADAGTPLTGHCERVGRLRELCRSHGIWLHLRGHSLAALALDPTPSDPVTVTTPRICDSVTVPLATWLGVPGLPSCTVYNADGVAGASLLTEGGHPARLQTVLPLWAVLQKLGESGIRQRVREAFESSEQLWRRLSKYPCLRMLSQQPGGEGGGGLITVADIISKPVNTDLLLEVVASAVVFQFVPEDCQERVTPYFDKLNSWLGQILQRDAPHLPVELCALEQCGVALRYCPLDTAPIVPSADDLDSFCACLDQQLEILSATVAHKETFGRLMEGAEQLRAVEVGGWAGLGGVRFVPHGWADTGTSTLTDQAKQELNRLNVQIVERLRATDAAFSLGEGGDGLACVRFGMVTSDTDVGELLALVEATGRQEEDSWRFIDTMAEVVKKGIEAATQDLQRENEEKLWQDGILRQVPVFGTLVNWWAPAAKDGGAGVKGRSLDLTAGVVASTENIYKYHMQGAKGGPPEPLVRTPVAGHSRASSVSSQQNNASSEPH